MSLFCLLFGHQPPIYTKKGWYSPGEEYAEIKGDYQDGIGRRHAEVFSKCARCGDRFKLCRVHLPDTESSGWYCGCGHRNGINLSVCAQCGRKPGARE